ncbi:MAG: Xylose isomerase domain protein barrel [Candidatus Solibacter sp.]|nr:Xylose isomerase domain protein barrel [Candidatus Solibacter sp.]
MKIFWMVMGMALLPAVYRQDAYAQKLANPFFAFDNGTGRDQKVPLAEQAELVKRTGYAGIGYTGALKVPEMLHELESRGLKMFSIYVAVRVEADKPAYDAALPEAIRQLKGHGTVIWLTVQGTAPDGEQRAVERVREVADLAAASGLRVVLYPHMGFFVGRIEEALRLRKLVDRPNVGITFNLTHFLAVKDEPNLDQRLREAMPYLEMVSINGAEHEGGWDRLILPLDRGAFDVFGFLKKLVAAGYKGPIGLQCYLVPGDTEENLKRSMIAWRKFQERL